MQVFYKHWSSASKVNHALLFMLIYLSRKIITIFINIHLHLLLAGSGKLVRILFFKDQESQKCCSAGQ
jgi:hypothetical protein